MAQDKTAEVFVFEDSYFFTTKTKINKVQEDRIFLQNTPLLKRFALLGKRIHFKYATFVLPSRVLGKSEKEIVISLPTLSSESPAGDRRSARVPPSHIHPLRLFIDKEGAEVEYEVVDISEGGFSILLKDPLELDLFLSKREVKVHIDFPVEAEEVRGMARLVNIQELDEGKIKLGFEMLIDDADMVKVRFYVYSRIKEILKG